MVPCPGACAHSLAVLAHAGDMGSRGDLGRGAYLVDAGGWTWVPHSAAHLALPLTLLYGALLGSTWTTQDLGDGGICH